jgi:hypothetical protein
MRAGLGLLFGLALLALVVAGCGPALSEEDLGTVIFDVREIPGGDQRYDLPDGGEPATSESAARPTDES